MSSVNSSLCSNSCIHLFSKASLFIKACEYTATGHMLTKWSISMNVDRNGNCQFKKNLKDINAIITLRCASLCSENKQNLCDYNANWNSCVTFHSVKHFIAWAVQFAELVRHAALAHFTEKQDISFIWSLNFSNIKPFCNV